MFVVIDGIDGSGKGTQVKIIEETLKQMWKTVLVLDYPRYGEKSAFMVEKYLNGGYWKDVWPKLGSLFYAVDRFEAYQELKNNWDDYDYIISNRYVSASMIHQTGKIWDDQEKHNFLEWLGDLEYNVFGIPKPDKTLFLNVSPQMSQKLVLQKEQRDYLKDGKKMDLHEEDKDHLKNAHQAAVMVANQNQDWVIINCEKEGEMLAIPEITKMILDEIL